MSAERRVLIIDPDPKARRQTAECLSGQNYAVVTGRNLGEAIQRIPGGGFGCLLLDVDLPEMKGYDAVGILKNLDPNLKIIMTTGKNTKRREARARQQDIFFYYIKSFGKGELKLAIENAFCEHKEE